VQKQDDREVMAQGPQGAFPARGMTRAGIDDAAGEGIGHAQDGSGHTAYRLKLPLPTVAFAVEALFHDAAI